AFPAEILRVAIEAIRKVTQRVENKIRTVKQIENDRHAVDRKKSRRLAARAVEVLIPAVERQREKAAFLPFEILLRALVVPNRRAAASPENKMQIFVEMPY